MSEISALFEEDAGALTVQDDQIASIASMAKRAKLLEKEIEEMESVVSERKGQLKKLLEESIPNMLGELGMKSFKMSDGSSIEVKPFYSATHGCSLNINLVALVKINKLALSKAFKFKKLRAALTINCLLAQPYRITHQLVNS